MKNFLIIALVLFSTVMMASADVKLPEIREVLKEVETNCNPDKIGDNGTAFGILQIRPLAIEDVNQKYGTHYTHQDAFDVICAEEIFELYLTIWGDKLEKREGREATVEDIVRIWNGGPRGYRLKSTKEYFLKYLKFKNKTYLCNMETNKRKCFVGGKLGIITGRYTHTVDVFMFKAQKTMYGVHKKYVKILPMDVPLVTNQLKIYFG